MSPRDKIQLKVGSLPLPIPIYDDERTTRQIVKQVNDRLRQIEDESERVDTLAFALQAAVAFAADLHRARAEHAEENKDILVALHAIVESLRHIRDHAPAPTD